MNIHVLPGLCGGVFMGKQTGRIASVPLCGCSEGSVNILPAFLLCSGCFLRTWPVHPPVSFRMTYHSPGRRLKGIAILHLPLHPPRLETQFRHHLPYLPQHAPSLPPSLSHTLMSGGAPASSRGPLKLLFIFHMWHMPPSTEIHLAGQ